MNNYLSKVPLQYRCFFYALPLFLQWIIGITWDKDEKAVTVARRSMALSIFYIALIATIFSVQEILFFILPDKEYIIRMFSFASHSFITLIYLLITATIAFSALLKRFNTASFLDAAAKKLEKLTKF